MDRKALPGSRQAVVSGRRRDQYVFCAFIFGVASGVELFLAPCLVIAALSCRSAQRRALAIYVTASLCRCVLLLHGRYGPPLFSAEPAQVASLLRSTLTAPPY